MPHRAIWNALEKKKVPRKLIMAIKSTFNQAEGIVRVNGKTSKPFKINNGIKQGDSLSPLLFTIVMDEIHKICRLRTGLTKVGNWKLRPIYAQALLFADDILLIADTETKLQNMVREWTVAIEAKGMEINPSKSKVMLVSKNPDGRTANIECKGHLLESATQYTYLAL